MAQNNTYILEVGGNRRKRIREGTPLSIRYNHRKFWDRHDCLVIQRNMDLFFFKGDIQVPTLKWEALIWILR